VTPYRWRERKCHSGKQFDLIDAQGKTVAFVQPSFPEWIANIHGSPMQFHGPREKCIEVVEKAFGMAKTETVTAKQEVLFKWQQPKK